MKNRTWERSKNGKFWCWHDWRPIGKAGPDWDITYGVRILCECTKCHKTKEIRNQYIKELPDHLIDKRVIYR